MFANSGLNFVSYWKNLEGQEVTEGVLQEVPAFLDSLYFEGNVYAFNVSGQIDSTFAFSSG